MLNSFKHFLLNYIKTNDKFSFWLLKSVSSVSTVLKFSKASFNCLQITIDVEHKKNNKPEIVGYVWFQRYVRASVKSKLNT